MKPSERIQKKWDDTIRNTTNIFGVPDTGLAINAVIEEIGTILDEKEGKK